MSLSVSSGEFVAILGPSGCGKSTLLELIAGLEPISRGDDPDRRREGRRPEPKAVMVFQEHSLFPWLAVEDNVAFGLKMKGVAPDDAPARARARCCGGCGSRRSRGTTRTSSPAA